MADQFKQMNALNGGEISPRMRGRTRLEKYFTSAETMLNFLPTPQGPVLAAPGFRYVADVKDSTKAVRLEAFWFNKDSSYVLEFGENYIRFYNYDGSDLPQQIQNGGSAVEVTTTYAEADLFDLKFALKNDTLYIVHPDYVTRKLVRHSDTVWSIVDVGFYPPALETPNIAPLGILTFDSLTGSATVTSSAATFLTGDVGKFLIHTAGSGKALVTGVTSTTVISVQIQEDFSAGLAGDTIAAGDWSLFGFPSGQVTADDEGTQGRTITLTSTGSSEILNNIGGGGAFWTASGSGTNTNGIGLIMIHSATAQFT